MKRQFKRFTTIRMAPKRIWQVILGLIFLIGFYLFLPAPETAIARQWLETFLGKWR
jgi:hypothetical protein